MTTYKFIGKIDALAVYHRTGYKTWINYPPFDTDHNSPPKPAIFYLDSEDVLCAHSSETNEIYVWSERHSEWVPAINLIQNLEVPGFWNNKSEYVLKSVLTLVFI